MSYGTNLPNGLVAIKYLNGAQWNGQVSAYLIESTYGANIGQGDLVYIQSNGYIGNLYARGSGTWPTAQSVGVFVGCSYVTTTASNPIDPASPGRSYWPANTATLNSVPAIAFVIDDPNTIFEIQGGSVGFTQAMVGGTLPVSYTTNSDGSPEPKVLPNGVSQMYANTGSVGVDDETNLRILRLSSYPDNVAGQAYNNAEVIIQFHSYCSRPVGI